MKFGKIELEDWSLSIDKNENYLFRNVMINKQSHYIAIFICKIDSEYCQVKWQKPLGQLENIFSYYVENRPYQVKGSLSEVKEIIDNFLVRMNNLLVFI